MRDSGINLQLPRSGQSHNLLCCCSQEWSVASLTFVIVPRSGQSHHLLCCCSQEWTVLSLALWLFPGVDSPVTCSVVVPRSGQSRHLLCCCSLEWSVPSLALLLFPGVVSPVTCSFVPRSGQSHHLLCCCWSFFFLFHSVIHYTQTCVSDTLNFWLVHCQHLCMYDLTETCWNFAVCVAVLVSASVS